MRRWMKTKWTARLMMLMNTGRIGRCKRDSTPGNQDEQSEKGGSPLAATQWEISTLCHSQSYKRSNRTRWASCGLNWWIADFRRVVETSNESASAQWQRNPLWMAHRICLRKICTQYWTKTWSWSVVVLGGRRTRKRALFWRECNKCGLRAKPISIFWFASIKRRKRLQDNLAE